MEFEFLHKPILFDTDYIRHADDLYIFSLQSDLSDQNHGSCFKQFKNLHPHTIIRLTMLNQLFEVIS